MNKATHKQCAILLAALSLAACGGGGDSDSVEEREPFAFEHCNVQLHDGRCPVDHIQHNVPNLQELRK